MAEYTMRRFQSGDEEGLTALSSIVWKTEPPPAYWTWKYLDNPWGDHFSYVAIADDRIIGFVGGMAWSLTVEGTDYPGCQVTDLMMHHDWRRKGVFYPLNRLSQDEIKAKASWHYGVTTPMSFKIYQNRYGYQGFRPHKMQRVLDIRPFLWGAIKRRKALKLPKASRLLARFAKPRGAGAAPKAPANIVVREIPGFDERYDALWSRLRDRHPIIGTRTRTHLQWRYADNPFVRYTRLEACEGETLQGYAVLKCERRDGILRGFIVDLFVDDRTRGTVSALLGAALQYFRRQKAAVANTWMFEHSPMFSELTGCGFVYREAETVMILTNSLTDAFSKEFMSERRHWQFAMGDCEAF